MPHINQKPPTTATNSTTTYQTATCAQAPKQKSSSFLWKPIVFIANVIAYIKNKCFGTSCRIDVAIQDRQTETHAETLANQTKKVTFAEDETTSTKTADTNLQPIVNKKTTETPSTIEEDTKVKPSDKDYMQKVSKANTYAAEAINYLYGILEPKIEDIEIKRKIIDLKTTAFYNKNTLPLDYLEDAVILLETMVDYLGTNTTNFTQQQKNLLHLCYLDNIKELENLIDILTTPKHQESVKKIVAKFDYIDTNFPA